MLFDLYLDIARSHVAFSVAAQVSSADDVYSNSGECSYFLMNSGVLINTCLASFCKYSLFLVIIATFSLYISLW